MAGRYEYFFGEVKTVLQSAVTVKNKSLQLGNKFADVFNVLLRKLYYYDISKYILNMSLLCHDSEKNKYFCAVFC